MTRICLLVILCSLFGVFAKESYSDKEQSSSFTPKISRKAENINGTEKWAYVDVRPDAHMFYWLYHSYHPNGYETRPLIMWLQGGPGASSCGYGNFEIIGPLDLDLNPRNTTWVHQANILFVDNPVGAGYSYVDQSSAYTRDVEDITRDLITLMGVFLEDNPEFKTAPFYVFGQSYGGKMGAHFARTLYDEMKAGNIEVNVTGFAMGNSWISPIDSTITWGPFLYWMSTVDEAGHDAIQAEAQKAQDAVNNGQWVLATQYWSSTEVVVIQKTNGVDFYNILKFVDYGNKLDHHDELRFGLKKALSKKDYEKLMKAEDPLDTLMNGPIKEKLGIIPQDVVWGAQSDSVFLFQEGDFMKPVVSVVNDAIVNTSLQVIVYQGQLDLICDTKAAMDWVLQFQWNGLGDYLAAPRNAFEDPADGQTEMFVKVFENFKFYWVLRAGHAVPKDAGETAFRMLERILGNMDT